MYSLKRLKIYKESQDNNNSYNLLRRRILHAQLRYFNGKDINEKFKLTKYVKHLLLFYNINFFMLW